MQNCVYLFVTGLSTCLDDVVTSPPAVLSSFHWRRNACHHTSPCPSIVTSWQSTCKDIKKLRLNYTNIFCSHTAPVCCKNMYYNHVLGELDNYLPRWRRDVSNRLPSHLTVSRWRRDVTNCCAVDLPLTSQRLPSHLTDWEFSKLYWK